MKNYQFTRQDFLRELLAFRDLMGSKTFWAKSEEIRNLAVRGFSFVYFNADLQPVDISFFEATLTEYARRETYMLFNYV
jgi:hypothetical protein